MQTILYIDLDDTILQNPLTTAVFPEIFKLFRKYRPDLDDRTLLSELITILEERYAEQRVDAFDWDELVQLVGIKYQVPVNISVEKLIQDYARIPYIRIYDHVLDTLKQLRKSNNRILCICTNGLWRYQSPTVQSLGLNQYFDYILAPDLLGCLKGHPRFYQHTLDGTKIRITIGDRYDSDIEWPKNLGFSTIWRPVDMPSEINLDLSPIHRPKDLNIPPPFRHKPDAIIKDFSEVIPTIESIEKKILSEFPEK